MKQQISDLMDGELDRSEHDAAWQALGRQGELRETWETYHLIGECLRGEATGVVRTTATERLMARLADEPTVLAPRARSGEAVVGGRTRIALAMAASVATLGVVGMIATRQPTVLAPAQLAQQPTAVQQVANGAPQPQVNDYLVVHRQFANPAAMQQARLVRDTRPAQQAGGK